MIQLINGRGQLGTELKKQLETKNSISDKNATIYHTWNFLDKSEETQKKEFEKFKEFLKNKNDYPLIFISTYSQQNNPYNYYKQLSEAYLINNFSGGYVIRLPVLIGKGICQKLKDNEAEPYGEIELMSVEKAAKQVISELEQIIIGNKRIQNIQISGDKIPAELAYELIKFGKI